MRKYVELLMQEEEDKYIFHLDRIVIILATLFDHKVPSLVSAALYPQGQNLWLTQWIHWLLLLRSLYEIWYLGLMWFTHIRRRAADAQPEEISIVLNCHPTATFGKYCFPTVTLSAQNLSTILENETH